MKNSALQTSILRLSRCSVGTAEMDAAVGVLERGFLGMGVEVKAFEEELAAYIGGDRHVLCVSTGTAALQLAVQGCGLGPGDEVLVPTLTFVASFQAVSATGAVPVACDVDVETAWLDVDDAAARVTPRTKGIMPVHYASAPGQLDRVYDLAAIHGLRVIEDAAHAFGCDWNSAKVGAAGDVVCFSFDGIKNITSGEGGAIVTADDLVANRVRDARLLGVEKDTQMRFQGGRSWEFDVKEQGWRYHMSDLFAAIGRVQLRRLDAELALIRRGLGKGYVALLAGVPGVRLLPIDYSTVVPHIFPVRITGGRRDEARAALLAEGIECGIHYKPNHLLTLYGGGRVRLPRAEQLYEELLTLPLHPGVTPDQQEHVVEVVSNALSGGRR